MERTLEWKKKVRSQKLVARTFMEGGRIRFIDNELWIRGWGRLLWLGAEQSVNCSAFFFPSEAPRQDALFSPPQEK